jgi:UDP-N-acetylmuramyl tripeptide synthase
MLRTRFAVAVARLASLVTRVTGHGGTALPGLVALRLDPGLIGKLTAAIPDGVVVVTGTNGKTTTARMIAAMLSGSGRVVIANRTGSNLARGVAAALVDAWRGGAVRADIAVFEVDEAAVRSLAPMLRPRLIVVTNLARDQLDRFGELATTASHVAVAVGIAQIAVLGADDPMVAGLAAEREGPVAWFGAVPQLRQELPDDRALYGIEASRAVPTADALVVRADAVGDGTAIAIAIDGVTIEAVLQVPGVYNAYNAAAALLAVTQIGLDPEQAVAALETMAPAFGRGQVVDYLERRVKVLLVKNPASLNQAIRLLVDDPVGRAVLLAINDQHADGRDVSWLWDASLELLADTPHRYLAGGIRAADMALRLKYAGIEAPSEPDLERSLQALVDASAAGDTVYLIPTYTAMLGYLDLLLPGRSREEVWS